MDNTNKLPHFCFCVLPTTSEVIMVTRNVMGYQSHLNGEVKGKEKAMELNEILDVTPAQMEAMSNGSLFGWDIPAANPDNFDENGLPKKRKIDYTNID